MAELLAGELSKPPVRGRLPDAGRFKEVVESTELLGADIGHPFASASVEANALDPANRHLSLLDVPRVLLLACQPQILDPVVTAITVDVVDCEAFRDRTAHVDPSQPMPVLLATKQRHFNVSVDLVDAAARLSNHVPTLGAYRSDPGELARFWAVGEERRNLFACRLCAGASHTK